MVSLAVLAYSLCGTVVLSAGASVSGGAAYITQHRINELAAPLEGLRNVILLPGLRQKHEALPAFFHRITLPLAGESRVHYCARVEGYLHEFAVAAKELSAFRTIPPLHANDAANRALWRRAVQGVTDLPGRVQKMREAWRHDLAAPGQFPPKANTLAGEMARTMETVVAAHDALRDAAP